MRTRIYLVLDISVAENIGRLKVRVRISKGFLPFHTAMGAKLVKHANVKIHYHQKISGNYAWKC